MAYATWNVLTQLAPWLLIGAAAAGLLHALLPAGLLRRQLRGRGGVGRAVLLGAPLPLCSCGVIPTGLGLKKQGAGDGATLGFLISTPQTGVDSVLVTAALLGWPLALFKVGVAVVTGLAGGLLAEAVLPSPAPETLLPDASQATPRNRVRDAVDHAIEMLRSIWLWIVVGVLLSAVLEAYLPAESLAGLSAYGGVAGMLIALVLSLPLYVCATASAPIAASLVASGLPAGAAIVFLMAGPATNLATIGAVYRVLGGRLLAVYLAVIIAGSVAGGLLFGWLVGEPSVAGHTHEHATPFWSTLSAAALLALFAWFAIDDSRRWWRRAPASGEADAIAVGVEGMTCQGCVAKLERVVGSDPAVESASVTLSPGRIVARGPIEPARLRELIRDAGFKASPS